MNMELFISGCQIMVIGMAIVFAFLAIMVFCIDVTSKVVAIINRYFPEEMPQEKTKKPKKDDTEIAVAIACAMRELQKSGGQK